MSRRTRQTGGGLTDRLPIARGAALGAAAYVVGYIITYLFVQVEDQGELEMAYDAFQSQLGIDIGTPDIVGWMFYNAQFVDLSISAEAMGQSQSESVSMLSEASDLTIPELVWYLVPLVCLLGAGFLTAKAIDRPGDSQQAAKAGATVLAGYLPLAAIGAFIFTASGDMEAGLGQSVSLSIGPDMMMAIVLVGIAYPLVLGAAGGALAAQTASTSGARPRGGGRRTQQPRHGQQPPQGQQGQPPQGGQQGHAGQPQQGHQQGQPPQGGQQGQGQSNQGNQRRR